MQRRIPGTEISVSTVSLGCWPIAGISSLDVNDADSIGTIRAAIDAGINHFDTAFSYGYDGEADRLLKQALRGNWQGICLSHKVGSHYTPARQRVMDSSPSRIRHEVELILKRLEIDVLPILYLHGPDGRTPIEEIAESFVALQKEGKIQHAALSNCSCDETRRFAQIIRPVLLQPPFNMLQREAVETLRPVASELQIGIASYWPLMKGLLAGKLARDHAFDPRDRRPTYAIYQGEAWQKSQDFLDTLRSIARELQWTVVRLVVRWTLEQEGITTVLCGAKRADQILESAEAMLSPIPLWADEQIRAAIHHFGSPTQ